MTPELLRAATDCPAGRAELYAPHLTAACAHYSIDTPQRLAAFLGQISHESGSLRYAREIASGAAYEGRKDLGNTQPGDGERYLGRGLIQCTGRSNYRSMARELMPRGAPDFEVEPTALESPKWAAWSAAAWWATRGCNELADRGEYVAIGRLINRGDRYSDKPANGEADRIARWERAKAALASQATTVDTEADPPAQNMPAGEAPDWVPPTPPTPPEKPMAPIIAGIGKAILLEALPQLVRAIPRLGSIFGAGQSEVAQRNVKALEVVAEVASSAMGATNAQDLVEGLADKDRVAAARNAVDNNWASIVDLVEAGGGGIAGARQADGAAAARGDLLHSPSFWITLALLPLVYLVVGSVVGLWGESWPSDVRAAIATAVVSLIVGGAAGYYWGQTTSRNRTPAP